MKILTLNYEFPPLGGGASPVTKELIENLAKSGHEIDVITMHYKCLEKYEKIGNINIYRVNCIRKKKEKSNFFEMFLYLFSAYLKGKELIINNKNKPYDLIHCHFIIPTGFVAYLFKKKFKLPYIITSHGSDVPGYNPDRFIFLHFLVKPLWKQIIKNSEKIITPSQMLKKLILKNYLDLDDTKISVIPNGINIINKKINLEKKEKIILYAGRLFKRKGVQYLIEVFDSLNLKDWQLFICGEGDFKPELQKIANNSKNKNKIKFLGWLDKTSLFKLYEKSSIFVLPSSEESFGMVLLEAMMFGNAIITTKSTGTEEVVNESGILINQRLNNLKNIKDFRSALKSLVNNKEKLFEYQKKALQRIKDFDWKKIIPLYLKEYKFVK